MRQCAKLLFLAALFVGCHSDPKNAPLFEKIAPEQSGINFTNEVKNSKALNIFNYRNFYNGGGVAIGDINNDGLPDVYLTANMGPNKLYLNKGNFQFEDITEKAGVAGSKGWSTGVVMVDINADGLLDIYVCNAGYLKGDDHRNEFFVNNGNLTFSEKAAEYGLDEDGYTTHAAFFDYDLDGDLDCYILNNSFMPVNTLNYSNNRELYAEDWPVEDFVKGGGDKLLRNDTPIGGGAGGVKFTDVSKQAGIYGSLIGFGLGITVGDVNGDNWPDLFVSNDFYERDYLYINQKNGTFKEDVENWMEHLSHASMGADMADINNDGLPEIFTTEMLANDEGRLKRNTVFESYSVYNLKQERGFYHQFMQNTLQLNNGSPPLPPLKGGGGTFSEIAFSAGVAASDWSWGALMFDMDNDGHRDIYVCNGIYKDVIDQDFINFFADEVVQKMTLTGQKEEIQTVIDKMPSNPILNKVFRNKSDLTFEDMGEKWGFTEPSFSNGAAYADLDNDGDLDLVVNNVNQPAFLFRNNENKVLKNHYIAVQLKGMGQNTFAIGSKVNVYRGSEVLNTQLIPSRGFQSSVDYKMIFGLGQSSAVDSLVVVWPDMTKSLLRNPAIDTLIIIDQKNAGGKHDGDFDPLAAVPKFVEEVPAPFAEHEEDGYSDFYQEGLTMRMVSREGPRAATADVNGDGLEDVFIGGAKGQLGQLYLQNAAGDFLLSKQPAFDRDSLFEDTAAAFFDADGDGDADLFVGSGGNEFATATREMQDRVYFNDGKGTFTLNDRALPLNGYNTSAVLSFDFDGDKDLDLIVFSRSVPGKYGVPPPHFVFENNGKGLFKNVTKAVAPDLITVGMATAAKLADLTGDGKPELIIVGEWTSPKVFTIETGRFEKTKTGLDHLSGWWYTLETADLDGDGDQDLVLGNRGDNFYFTGSEDAPARLWVADFDKNGTFEKIITRQIGGRDMPVPMKKELTDQIPSLKKANLKHEEYAKKAIQDLFPKEVLDKALVWRGTYFKSAVALNEGGLQFKIVPLPKEVQLSCVCGILCEDLNGDGKKDLLMGGNDTGFMPQFGRLDASFGHTLLNKGDGNFEWVKNRASGFFVRGNVKQVFEIKRAGERLVAVLLNDGRPLLFRFVAGKKEQ